MTSPLSPRPGSTEEPMMSGDAPIFPREDMEELAAWYDFADDDRKSAKDGQDDAKMLRDAIGSYTLLEARCDALRAEIAELRKELEIARGER